MIGIAAVLTLASALSGESMDAISGDWATKDNGAVVRLEPCAEEPSQLCGAMVWIKDPAWLAEDWIGRRMIEGFEFVDGSWKRGRLTNPEDGRVYRGSMRLAGEDELRLKGCAARIFCSSQTWRRVDQVPAPGEMLTD